MSGYDEHHSEEKAFERVYLFHDSLAKTTGFKDRIL